MLFRTVLTLGHSHAHKELGAVRQLTCSFAMCNRTEVTPGVHPLFHSFYSLISFFSASCKNIPTPPFNRPSEYLLH